MLLYGSYDDAVNYLLVNIAIYSLALLFLVVFFFIREYTKARRINQLMDNDDNEKEKD